MQMVWLDFGARHCQILQPLKYHPRHTLCKSLQIKFEKGLPLEAVLGDILTFAIILDVTGTREFKHGGHWVRLNMDKLVSLQVITSQCMLVRLLPDFISALMCLVCSDADNNLTAMSTTVAPYQVQNIRAPWEMAGFVHVLQ